MSRLPWWRQPPVTGWDRGIALALFVVIAFVLQPVVLGDSWGDTWIAAGSWFVLVVALLEIRLLLSRRSGP
jgi:hypothetical protein